jgi:tripartite-type tricarboxylate transporter receptor subunit TctC
VQSFAPITLVNTSANVLVAHPSVPATTTQALIALAKAKPGQINYASAGSGHFAASRRGAFQVDGGRRSRPRAL